MVGCELGVEDGPIDTRGETGWWPMSVVGEVGACRQDWKGGMADCLGGGGGRRSSKQS